jgi:tetratricopeptide (TPR) repeat protein
MGARFWPAEREARRVRVRELRRMDDLVAGPELAAVVDHDLQAWVADPALADARLNAGSDRSEAPGPIRAAVDVAPTIESRPARERLTLIASMAQLSGWVAADAGAPDAALSAFRLGLRAAEQGGDRPLAGHIVGGLAQLTAEDGDARAALRLARSAQRRAGATASSGVRSLLALRLAYAAAVGGLRRECEEALAVAERAAAQRDTRLDPDWLYWLDEAHFAALIGRCHAALGRPATARPLLESALRTKRVRFRAAGIIGATLATVRLEAGDLDGACAAATDALIACVQSGSMRAATALRAFDRRLGAAAPAGRPLGTATPAGRPLGTATPAGRRPAPVRDYARLVEDCRSFLPTMRGGPIPLRVVPGSPVDQDRHTSILQDAQREPRRAGGIRPG